MNRWILIASLLLGGGLCTAQNIKTPLSDSVFVLDPIIVKGYASDRPLNEVPASIGYLNAKNLERYNNTSILSAVNTIPGVRMEERSPGSYRFAIRGSSLRSPFGIRNVKMYWNGLPLTDGGGNTYLNLLDYNAIGTIEVIKGPGSSLYGAGTGGVVLLNSPSLKDRQLQFTATGGSYGLQRYQLSGQTGSEKAKIRLLLSHQESNGYRQQSAMRRDALNSDLNFIVTPKGTLSGTIFYTDLYYQTPGGLTQAQYDLNPRLARPDGKSPGSVAQQAAIYNKTIFTGWNYDHEWNSRWSNRTGVYGSFTNFTNPAIRNYEERKEKNWGGRTETHYKIFGNEWKGKFTLGAELQFFQSPIKDYGNRAGVKDTLQFADKLGSSQAIVFLQTEFDLPFNFYLTLGGSTTFLQYRFLRTSSPEPIQQNRNFTPILSPRIALLKKLTPAVSAYGSISQGFSTPSLAEVRPSSNLYNNTLNPEYGRNYEIGLRGTLFHQKVSIDLTGYYFNLKNTIVTPDGGDHYLNSGKTSQPGIESGLGWSPIQQSSGFISNLKLWSNYTYNPYLFKNYFVGTANYSGHKLTGVARNIIVSGIDFSTRKGIYGNLTFTHTSSIPLNDANTSSAASYYLMGARVGYHFAKWIELFGGVDNAFNTKYSLGNDLNAIGNYYFNAAARRNFYLSMKVIL